MLSILIHFTLCSSEILAIDFYTRSSAPL